MKLICLFILFVLTPQEYIRRGLDEKDPELQVLQFTKAIKNSKENKDLAIAYYNRGIAYYNDNKYKKAYLDFEECLKINPKDFDSLLNAGLSYDAARKYSEAILKFDQMIEFFPESIIGYFNRGNVYLHKKQYDLAISDYNIVLDLNPLYIDALNNLGWAYYFKKQFTKSLEYFQKALILNPEDEFALEGKKTILEILDRISFKE